MIFNYCYGGIKIVTITINGAPGEKVTLTPTKTVLNTIEVTLNDKGVYTGEVSKDKYTFVGEVSKEVISSLTYEVEDGGVYNLWGTKKVIFWYGREFVSFRYHTDNGRGTAKNTGTSQYCGSSGWGGGYATDITYAITSSTIDTTNYSKLMMIIEPTYFYSNGNYANDYRRYYYGFTSTLSNSLNAVTGLSSYKSSASSKQTISLSSPKTSVYIGTGTIANHSASGDINQAAQGYCYAIWLE